MKIYHYTSIDTLALILRNQTLRFNNANNVDDLAEAESNDRGSFKDYTFISSWTSDEKENIALWNMYSKNMRGIRIGVDEKKVVLSRKVLKDNSRQDGSIFVVGNVIPENKSSIYINWTGWTPNAGSRIDIRYDLMDVPQFHEVFKEGGGILNFQNLASRKRPEWSFQKEVRFVLFGASLSKLRKKQVAINRDTILESIINKEHFKCNYVDLKLSQSFFSDIEVLLGPRTTESDRIIVESLMNRFLGKISYTLNESILTINRKKS